jgi:DNA-directed RNA polymerase specialized sigma24 family protein
MTAESFFNQYESVIANVLRKWIAKYRLTLEEREDLTQECRLRLYRLAKDVETGKTRLRYECATWYAYVATLSRNTAFTWLQKHKLNIYSDNSEHQGVDSHFVGLSDLPENEDGEPMLFEELCQVSADETLPDVSTLRRLLQPDEQLIFDNILLSNGNRYLLVMNLMEATGLSEERVEKALCGIKERMTEIGMTL